MDIHVFHQLARIGDYKGMEKYVLDALETADVFEVKELINTLDKNGQSALHYAVYSNNLKANQFLLKCCSDVNLRGKYDITPLMCAARSRHERKLTSDELIEEEKIFILLINSLDNLNQTDIYGQSALHYAVMKNNTLFLKILLQKESLQIELQDNQNMTAAHFAAAYGHFDAMKMLIDKNINITIFDKFHRTPLQIAAGAQDPKIFKLLLETLRKKYPKSFTLILNNKDVDNKTCFQIAIEKDNFDVVKMLVDEGIKCDQIFDGGNYPIHLAAKSNSVEILNLLISSSNCVSALNGKKESPLHIAAAFDKTKNIELLLKMNANTFARQDDRFTPLMMAVYYGNPKSVQVLLDHNARIYNVDNYDRNSIFLAAQKNQNAVLKILLNNCNEHSKSVVINSVNYFGDTPLIKACEKGFVEIVKTLLSCNANSAIKNDREHTAMHLAAQNGFIEIVKILADYNITLIHELEDNSNTPLHLASYNGHKKVVEFLIKSGADSKAGNQFLMRPLDCAAENGKVKTCEILLENDVPINSKNKANTTTLYLASSNGHSEVVNLLLEKGANVKFKDPSHLNCLDIAINNNKKDVVKTILNSSQWMEALRNKYYSENKNEVISPMRLLIEKMPDVAHSVLSSCITTNNKSRLDPNFEITYNYEFLEDVYVDWSDKNYSCIDLEKQENNSKDATNLPKNKKLDHQIFHPLEWMVKYQRKELLWHPLSRELVHSKWKSFGYLLLYSTLVLSLLFVFFQTMYLIYSKTYNSYSNSTTEFNDSMSKHYKYCTLVIVAILGFREIFQLVNAPLKYLNIVNFMEITSLVFAVIPMIDTPINRKTGMIEDWQWQMSTFSIFLACMNTILNIEKSLLGKYVVMFVNVLKTFLKFSVILILFIISFGIVFNLLLKSQDGFKGFAVLLKTGVMMTGEINYGDIFYSDDTVPYPFVTYLIFIIFIIFMLIIVMNLMVGLAVDDIQAVQKEAQLQKMAKQVELVIDTERLMNFDFMPTFIKKKQIFYPNKKRTFLGIPLLYDRPMDYNSEKYDESDTDYKFDQLIKENESIRKNIKEIKKWITKLSDDQLRKNELLIQSENVVNTNS